MTAFPDQSQLVFVWEWAEVTRMNGPESGWGEASKKATKNCPVGAGSLRVPTPAGALR